MPTDEGKQADLDALAARDAAWARLAALASARGKRLNVAPLPEGLTLGNRWHDPVAVATVRNIVALGYATQARKLAKRPLRAQSRNRKRAGDPSMIPSHIGEATLTDAGRTPLPAGWVENEQGEVVTRKQAELAEILAIAQRKDW